MRSVTHRESLDEGHHISAFFSDLQSALRHFRVIRIESRRRLDWPLLPLEIRLPWKYRGKFGTGTPRLVYGWHRSASTTTDNAGEDMSRLG
jgi:hypothetical protein